MHRVLWIAASFALVATIASAQSETGNDQTAVTPVLPRAEGSILEPIYPERADALISVEAEDAVSTNFAKEPTLNYGASGSRTLQLNRYTGLYGGAAFFAEFVIYVEAAGTYELWYGGTPPGPREDINPSYASPFSYRLDGGPPIDAYREDVTVVDGYMPSYYWVHFGAVELVPGIHTIRIEIDEKRRFDGKFFFYLDTVFLVDRQSFDVDASARPRVFPEHLDRAEVDSPFLSINDYEYLISQQPDNPAVYIELSLVYSLIGDYNSALKNLNRAALITPSDPQVQLLMAKNRIWKGDAAEGLRAYDRLLRIDPSLVDAWAEAGKVAAWIGQYRDAIRFFRSGMRQFPDDLTLIVNLGITYLWDTQPDQAAEMFSRAHDVAWEDAGLIVDLADIYMVNGYPDLAIDMLIDAIRDYPPHLGLYLKLEEAYTATGRIDDADTVHSEISSRFEQSERLDAYLDTFRVKQTMKDEVIDAYQERLKRDPDNLSLRELLVQTYFWNGLRQRAIDEYLNILTNYAYRTLTEFDARNSDLLESIDRLHLYRRFLANAPDQAREFRGRVEDVLDEYADAVAVEVRHRTRVEAAREKGEDPPVVEGIQPAERRALAENAVATVVREVDQFLDWIERGVSTIGQPDREIEPYLIEEQENREAFAQVAGSFGWEWDRSDIIDELDHVSTAGVVLADHVLAKLHQVEGDYRRALARADLVLSPTTLLMPSIYLLQQTELWASDAAITRGYIPAHVFADYQEYTESLNALALQLRRPSGARGAVFTETAVTRAEALMDELDQVRASTAPLLDDVIEGLETAHAVLENRFRRIWYQIDQDTYLIRFELGDYYLLEEEYQLAIEQFEKVLVIDPWNTSATFKLGTVHQLAGNWRRAMELYRQVYFADPKYENVARNYNDLARRYADSLDFESRITADSSLIGYHSSASFTNNLTGSLGLELEVTSDTVRRYLASGGRQDETYQLNSVGASVPIRLSRLQTTLTPNVGATVSTELFATERTPSETDPPSVFGSYIAEPYAGAELGVSAGPIYIGAVYRYHRVGESYHTESNRVVSHSAEANAVLSFGFLGIPEIQYSSIRSYGKADMRFAANTPPNFILTLAQEFSQVFHLSDSPWTNLTLTGNAIYEGGTLDSDLYFVPNDVLQAGGGLSFATWLGVNNGNVLGFSVQATAGVYASNVFEDPTSDLSLAANGRVEYTKGDSTYYAVATANGTLGAGPELSYWSAGLTFGYGASLPRLLAD